MPPPRPAADSPAGRPTGDTADHARRQAEHAANTAITLLQSAHASAARVAVLIGRIRGLALQATGSMAPRDRRTLEEDFERLATEIDDITRTARQSGTIPDDALAPPDLGLQSDVDLSSPEAASQVVTHSADAEARVAAFSRRLDDRLKVERRVVDRHTGRDESLSHEDAAALAWHLHRHLPGQAKEALSAHHAGLHPRVGELIDTT